MKRMCDKSRHPCDERKCMTVAELMAALEKLPPDMPVRGTWEGIDCALASVTTSEEYYSEPWVALDVDNTGWPEEDEERPPWDSDDWKGRAS